MLCGLMKAVWQEENRIPATWIATYMLHACSDFLFDILNPRVPMAVNGWRPS